MPSTHRLRTNESALAVGAHSFIRALFVDGLSGAAKGLARCFPALGMTLCLVLALALGGCAGQSIQPSDLTPQVVGVDRGDIVDALQIGGQVTVMRQAKLNFDLPVSQQAMLKTLDVKVGQPVEAGQLIATMDTSLLERAVTEAETELQRAQSDLTRLTAPAKPSELALAHVAVTSARTELLLAQKALEKLQKPDLAELQAKVADAEQALNLARLDRSAVDNQTDAGKTVRDLEYAQAWQQRRLAELADLVQHGKANVEQSADYAALGEQLKQTGDALTLARAQAQSLRAEADAAIQKAVDDLTQARKDLADAQAGADALALAKAQDAVASAQLGLDRAGQAEATLKAGSDPEKRTAAETAVADRQRSLDEAQAAVRRARLVSPFAGVIADLPTQVGEMISSRTVIAELDDLKTMSAVASVDETEITKLREGQAVQLTIDAFPGEQFKGTVGAIPLQGKLDNDVLVFEVPIAFDYHDLPLKPGMSVLLAFELGRADNALRVPTAALITDASGVSVELSSPVRKRASVKTGVSDGLYTEIVSGLRDGDLVIVPLNQSGPASNVRGVGVMIP